MKFKEINYPQGTPEWLAWRRTKLGATDTAKICGKSKWGNPYDVYVDKIEGKEVYVTQAMREGTEREPKARAFLIKKYGINFKPKCFESIDYPMFGASYDAISDDNKISIEIKCPQENMMAKVLDGYVEEDHIWQCHKQMLILGLEKTSLLYYFNDDIYKEVKVKREERRIAKILKEEPLLWNNHILPKIAPENPNSYEKEDNFEANEKGKEWVLLKKEQQEINIQLKDVEAELKVIADGKNVIFTDARIKHKIIERIGTVDWKKIQTKWEISNKDVEEFRKKGSKYSIFSLID